MSVDDCEDFSLSLPFSVFALKKLLSSESQYIIKPKGDQGLCRGRLCRLRLRGPPNPPTFRVRETSSRVKSNTNGFCLDVKGTYG